ncbi:MAG TPA: hypothetical protein PKO36_05150 [Candidatus Hydrogenedentes bacterium]|nr:hypothetical protein [Candidatus Hydrogenedentota bacterium]HOV75249.1 hypothetical protein [Candidatus Hydrogenedentota bacterium]HPC17025.1 hypothetical protein [Candidatus Hydrogenedentota bacterium]HRT20983.1 hypothetical protein [Candidatus Hydrogenedentota bacterium]HRT65812.1 hypothetical protein [Candidatus Hydrogenedentota bacterium]
MIEALRLSRLRHTILGIVAFLIIWAVAIGVAIFIIDCMSRLVRAMELGAEARMR